MIRPIKNLVILLNPDSAGTTRLERISLLLRYLAVVADVYIATHDSSRDALRIKRVIADVVTFVRNYSFYRLNIHPVHPFSSRPPLETLYDGFSRTLHPFNKEAFRHQSIARLMILPILTVDHKTKARDLEQFLTFLRERTMVPSLYFVSGVATAPYEKLLCVERERILLEVEGEDRSWQVPRTLCRHFDFDDLLAWAAGAGGGELPPCRSVVYDEKRETITTCLEKPSSTERWLTRRSPGNETLGDLEQIDSGSLLRHHLETSHLLEKTLRINGRIKEWIEVAVQLGMECVKRTWYSEALQQFHAGLAADPGSEDKATLYIYEALCHLKLGHISEAQAALNRAEKMNPSLALTYYYRGHCEFALRDYIEAIDLMQKALDMGAQDIPQGDAYFYMGMSHINILEYDDGLRMMRNAQPFYTPHQLSPVLYYMGVCHFGNHDISTAYDFFQKALAANPNLEDLSSIYLYLAMCHKEQQNYGDALAMLEKARDAEEDRLEIHNLMGYCYFKLKEHEKAIDSFVRAVEIDPTSGIDWANLGVNVRATGDDEKALLLFKKAISLDPTIGFAWKHLQELTKSKNS